MQTEFDNTELTKVCTEIKLSNTSSLAAGVLTLSAANTYSGHTIIGNTSISGRTPFECATPPSGPKAHEAGSPPVLTFSGRASEVTNLIGALSRTFAVDDSDLGNTSQSNINQQKANKM